MKEDEGRRSSEERDRVGCKDLKEVDVREVM
jgi:hypothetical protein